MKKVRTVIVVLSTIYVVLTIIFLLNFDSLFSDFNILKKINYLQGWIVASVVLLSALIIAGGLYMRSLKSRYKKLEKEHDTVKGRVYEIEEERKAEIARQKAEEEETERKLEAFNSSLKGRNRDGRGQSGSTIDPGHLNPEEGRTDTDKPYHGRPAQPGPDSEGNSSDDKPVQL